MHLNLDCREVTGRTQSFQQRAGESLSEFHLFALDLQGMMDTVAKALWDSRKLVSPPQ